MLARFRPHRAVLALACASLALQPSPALAENYLGTAGNDVITGTSGGDLIEGEEGDDVLRGDPAAGDGPIVAIRRVSTGSPDANGDEAQSESASGSPVLSRDGGKLLFSSGAVFDPDYDHGGLYLKDLRTGTVELVSTVKVAGVETAANGDVLSPVFSPDGTKIAFSSSATNLGGGPTNNYKIYVKSLITGEVTLVSADSAGTPANGFSVDAVFSPNGNKIAFRSTLSNLGLGAPATDDIFVKDLTSLTLDLVSATELPELPANGSSYDPVFSPDGNSIAFSSLANNLVAGDTNGFRDVFIKDLNTKTVVLVSSMGGVQGDGYSSEPSFSPDGLRIAFKSNADTFDANPNQLVDVFALDLISGALTLLTAASPGANGVQEPANGNTTSFVMAEDWSRIAFISAATNLGIDADAKEDAFSKNLQTGIVTLISATPPVSGQQQAASNASSDITVSGDGSAVAFSTPSNNLLPGDTNGVSDIFLATLPPGPGADDILIGGHGADTLIGGPQNDMLWGGNGMDTAVYAGPRRRYEVSDNLDGLFSVLDKAANSPEGEDLLSDVELLKFGNDAPVSVSNPGPNNLPPVVAAIGPLKVKAGAAVGPVEVVATDPEGDPLAVTVLSGGLFGQTTLVGNAFTYTAGPAGQLPHFDDLVQILVSDPYGGSTTIGVAIDIGATVVADPGGGFLTLGEGDDVAHGGAGVDEIFGGGGDDVLSGGGGDDILDGGDGNDTLDGGAGADQMVGGTGDDTYFVDDAGDIVVEHAGEGHDTVESAVSFTLPAHVEDLILTGDAPISGAGNDLDNAIAGNDAANTLLGHAGDDTLVGKGGPDRLDGGPGADMMTGNAGDDTYVVDDAGDVVVEIPGGGVDTVESAITYVLPADVENLKLIGSASIGGTGNGLANVIIGNSGDNSIDGGSGNDTLVGGAGNDTILGGAGNDTIEGGLGADTLDGGPGVDTLSFAGRHSGVKADLKSKTIDGDAVKGFENLTGSAFNDELSGTNGANVIIGGGGADRIEGRKGRDRLTGGAGKDVFVFRKVADSPARAPDTITDFRAGDRIDLSAFDANTRKRGRQRFTWRGAKKFTRKPGELRFAKRALWADTDGDGRADFKVLLPGVKSLAKKAVKLR